MSFLDIKSSWDSGSDDEDPYFIRTGPEIDLKSHPTTWEDVDSDDDETPEERDRRIMKMMYERSKVRDNASAERIGGEKSFGQALPRKKVQRDRLDVQSIGVGDVFYDIREKLYGLVVGKDFKNMSEDLVVLLAEGDEKRELEAYPLSKFSLSDRTKYVTSFDEPLKPETLQYFLFHYSNKDGWSRDRENNFYRALDSDRDKFGKFLDMWGVHGSFLKKKNQTKPGKIDVSKWENF